MIHWIAIILILVFPQRWIVVISLPLCGALFLRRTQVEIVAFIRPVLMLLLLLFIRKWNFGGGPVIIQMECFGYYSRTCI